MNLVPILNNTSPQSHMELELDVLGVHKMLVYKKLKKIKISSYMLSKQQSTSFWSQRILGIKANKK